MKRLIGIGVGAVLLLLAGVAMREYSYLRRVDGRSPAQWLAYTEWAHQHIAYRADGQTVLNGMHARFVIDQGVNGHYVMSTRDTRGHCCSLGYDGDQVWYVTETAKEKIAVSTPPRTPVHARVRILGTATVAERPVVQLAVSSGREVKMLAIDRKTGIPLSITTSVEGHRRSEMRIEHIAYHPVDLHPCALEGHPRARAVDRATLTAQLGGKIVEPQWLPQGYVLTDMLLEPCGECGQPMAVLRYSDGITAVTLFEMSRQMMMCDMGTGCRQSDDGHALVVNTTVGAFSVTAVGTVDAATMQRMLAIKKSEV